MSAYKNSRYPTGVQGLLPWCGILLAVVLVGGWFFVDFFTRFGEELERQELLVTAATAAASFDGGELQSLNGDTDNQSALIFTRAREKLQRLRAAVPRSRFVYLMALRNGDVVFLADAEPVNSPDYSSPGEVYAEASPALRRVFATATAATEGPLPDHWGEWVSGLAPILDPVTGDVAAIIGIDISAEHWQKTVAHFRWLGLGVSAGFSAVVLFFGFLAYRQYRLSAKLTAANHIAEEAQAVAHVGSWSFDLQDRTLSWSAEHYRIYGVDPATFQPTYEQVVARTHPDDRASFEREYGRAVESHSVFELDKRIVMDDGSTRFVHDRGRTYYDAKGRPVRSIGTVQDITDRRIAEERMVFTNTLLTTQMETSPDGMLVVDENGGIISFNRRFADMWQVPIDLLHGGSDAPVLAAVTSAAKDPEKFLARVQYLYQHPEEAGRDELETKDGRFIDRHTAALRGDTGQYLGRVWFFRDITERKRAEEEMRASEERLRIVFSSVSDGIFITDMKTGKFIEINQPGCAMFGYSRDELVGRDIVALSSDVFPNTQIRATELLGKARADGPQTLEWHCRTKEGRLFWVEASLRYTAFGNREVVLATLRDISERKNAHAQIERMARYDGLTGLANRGVFMEVVQQEIAHAGRGGRTFAVLYLDLDHFKDVNDTLGHPVGDELLKSVAARLLSNARETDIVARFGGDEFAVIAADLNEPANAAILADALIKSLREPFSIQGNDIRTGASLGISVFGPEEPDAETLLSHADVALYRAKSEGRGAYRFLHRLDGCRGPDAGRAHDGAPRSDRRGTALSPLPAKGRHGDRPDHRSGSAGALASPRTRRTRAGHFYTNCREKWLDRCVGTLGAAGSLPAGEGMARRGLSAGRSCGESLRRAGQEATRAGRRYRSDSGENRTTFGDARARADGNRPHGSIARAQRLSPAASPTGHQARDRRLRNRIFLPRLSAPIPCRPDQDCADFRPADRNRGGERGHREGDHWARPGTGDRSHRGRCRHGRGACAAEILGMSRSAGVLLRQAAFARGPRAAADLRDYSSATSCLRQSRRLRARSEGRNYVYRGERKDGSTRGVGLAGALR